MIVLLETDDTVRLHFLKMVLEEAELHPFLLRTDSAYRSMTGRLLVPESEAELARHVIAEAEQGLAGEGGDRK